MGGMGDPMMGTQQQTAKTGFIVVIEGYSPYKDISKLLDPPGVGADQSRWGVVTRFENLKELFPEIPFELYEKEKIEHFKEDWGLVDQSDPLMPSGIGIEKEVERVPSDQAGVVTDRTMPVGASLVGAGGRMAVNPDAKVTRELVLFDPMTNEEISKTFDIVTEEDVRTNPEYTENDLGKKKLTAFREVKYIERDSWFRIQAMFRFEEAHMFLIIGTAVVVGAISLFIIRRLEMKTVGGDPIVIREKPFNKGIVVGGILFGMGWAITGACPGPIYAQIGSGAYMALVTFVSALIGAYLYAFFQPKLPH